MRLRRLTLGKLPRIFVKILDLSAEDQSVLLAKVQEITSVDGSLTTYRGTLPSTFVRILEASKDERRRFAGRLDLVLDELRESDFFGTEGQLDPRGDLRG
jgi:hypothetical protein